MSGPTPGPWSYCGHARGGCVCGLVFGGDYAVACTSFSGDDELRAHEPDKEARKANARLIAAAPELLEALELVGMSAGFQYMTHETQEFVSAAIAKATGAQP